MDIEGIKKIVSDAYAVADNATQIPKYSTQFIFSDEEILVRIPIFECQPPPRPLVALIVRVINAALPQAKKKPEGLEQDLLTAAEGKQIRVSELDVFGVVESTVVSESKTVHAVTECRVRIKLQTDLELNKRFDAAMMSIYSRALKEANYHASIFHQMIGEHGGYQTAKTLIHALKPSDGYPALWERGRLDLTVEALILDPEWHNLFTDDDRLAAQRRLEQYNYKFNGKR